MLHNHAPDLYPVNRNIVSLFIDRTIRGLYVIIFTLSTFTKSKYSNNKVKMLTWGATLTGGQKVIKGTQRKARDIVIHNIICSSELARMYGMSYISQLESVKNTRLAARNPILQRILAARSSNKKTNHQQGNILNEFSDRHLDVVH